MKRYAPAKEPPLRVICVYTPQPDWLEGYLRALAVVVPELRGVSESEPEAKPEDDEG